MELDRPENAGERDRLECRAEEVGDAICAGGIRRLPEDAEATVLTRDMKMHGDSLGEIRHVSGLPQTASSMELALIGDDPADSDSAGANLEALAIGGRNGNSGGGNAGGGVDRRTFGRQRGRALGQETAPRPPGAHDRRPHL